MCVVPSQVNDVVVCLDESLRPAASGVAQQLRRAGRTVELVLENKKLKWAIKVCDDTVTHTICAALLLLAAFSTPCGFLCL